MLSVLNFQNSLKKLLENPQQSNFLLAISGGVDSMVLLNLFIKLGLNFQVAHVNYHLRDDDSNLDQELVQTFCNENRIKFHLYDVSEKDNQPQNSIENWARDLRYRFFRTKMAEENIEFLVTAHHLNDQLETFLINLSKASGLRGLSGIPADENYILRPFLDFSKDEIYAYAKEYSIDFREDYTNAENIYLRNKIRNKITPELLKLNNQFLENFSKSIKIINQSKKILENLIDEKFDNLTQKSNGQQIVIDNEKLSLEPELIQYEVLKRLGFSNEKEMAKVFTAQSGKVFYLMNKRLVVNRNELILELVSDAIIIDLEETELNLDENGLVIIPDAIKNQILEFGSCCWFFDRDKLKFPLKLRHKKEGDLFYPVGMKGKKKLSKFFKDEKISILAKPKIWLLCDGNDDVLGVLPFRQDCRYSCDQLENNIEVKIINKE